MQLPREGGDGAFYAPKIDIQVKDALGREWQTATIQVDLVMLPERFDLTYIDENGGAGPAGRDPPRDLGSLERFIGVMIEHTGGALPFWCSPVQAVVVPIADRHNEGCPGAGGRHAMRAGCGWRSTTRRTGCRTRSV